MNDTEISATVAALLVGLGAFLKNQTPLNNNWIPSVLMLAAIAATLGLTGGWTSVETWIKAIMAGFTAVGVHSGTRSTMSAINPPADGPKESS